MGSEGRQGEVQDDRVQGPGQPKSPAHQPHARRAQRSRAAAAPVAGDGLIAEPEAIAAPEAIDRLVGGIEELVNLARRFTPSREVGRSGSHLHEPPLDPDPLADYDLLYRKQPKRLGFIEVARAMPWALQAFRAEVPGEWFALDGDVAVIACPCKVDPPPAARFNVVTRCEGEDCGRWFFFDGTRVLVAKEPEPNAGASGP